MTRGKSILYWAFSLVLYAAFGFWYVDHQLGSQKNQAVQAVSSDRIYGMVITSPSCRNHRMASDLKIFSNRWAMDSTIVHVQVNRCISLKMGDQIVVTGSDRLIHPLINFYRQWDWLSHWSERASVIWKATNCRLIQARSWYQHPIMVLQDRMGYALRNWTLSDRFMACVSAWVLGSSRNFSEADRQVLANTGTSHLMAISGLHIGLIFNLMLRLLLNIIPYSSVRWPAGLIMRLISWCVVGLFVVFTGAHLPSLRALLMLAVYVIFYAMRLPVHMAEILAMSVILLFLVDPLMIWSLSAILSTLAVWGLTTSGQSIKNIFYVQWQLWWFLIPINLFFFSGLSLSSLIANLFAIPYATFLVPIVLMSATMLMIIPILGQFLMVITDGLLMPFWWMLQLLSNLPGSYFNFPAWPGSTLMFAVVSMLWVRILVQSIVYRSYWHLMIFLCGWWLSDDPVKPGEYRLTVLDVGRGLSVVIQTANHVLVYDTGGQFYDPSGMSRYVLQPFLKAAGITRLDRLVISHDDVDHAGGRDWLIEKMPIRDLLMPQIQKNFKLPAITCRSGDQWVWDGVVFRVLAPKWLTKQSNDHSCVISVSGPKRTLLTGDASAWSEQQMLSSGVVSLSSDYLLIPHHGSRTSSSSPFLYAVSPSIAIISVVYYDPYRLPHPQIKKRYIDRHIQWLSTANQGAIQLDVRKDKTDIYFAIGKWVWWRFDRFNLV